MKLITLSIFIFVVSIGSSFAKNNEKTKAVKQIDREFFINNIWDYETNEDEFVFKGDTAVIIDFYANWCAPCRIAAPVFEDVASLYEGKVIAYKVNIDKESKLAANLGINSLPLFLLISKDGELAIGKGISGGKEGAKLMFENYFEALATGKSLTNATQ